MGVVASLLGKIVTAFGGVMIVLGAAAYLLTGMASVTALIPSFFGVALVVCGVLAPKVGKPALIVALVLCVLGALGPLGRIVPQAIRGDLEIGAPLVVQVLFVILAVTLAVILVKGRVLGKPG